MAETVMIVAGETSGELYGSLLAASIRKKSPGVRIVGIGGELMRAAGVELIAGIASAFGVAELLTSLKTLRQTFAAAVNALKERRPAVLVLIDYPDFNLRLAAEARRLGIKVLYYVSPQVWAWRKGRVGKIAALVDRMAVILPFEEAIYRETGLPCEFVGHPVNDEIEGMRATKGEAKAALGLAEDRPLLALLPGSRPNELDRLLPLMIDVLRQYRREHPAYQFCVPFAPNTDLSRYRREIATLCEAGASVSRGESLRVLAAADLAVIASGTASLQAALLDVPLVVVYRLFPLTYWLGRRIVKVRYISLVNVLMDRPVVRELIQHEATAANVLHELKRIESDQVCRTAMIDAFSSVRSMFAGKRASDRVAAMALEMALDRR